MIFRRLALALAAAACLATAAAVAVVALAYAFFAALRDEAGLSSAWASACVVGLAAALILIAALVLKQAASGGHRRHHRGGGGHADLADTLADLVRDRPIAATAVAAVAGWVMTRNPALARTLETLISRRGRGDRR